MPATREHWDGVYTTKGETEVSWYQPRPERSLAFIKFTAPSLSDSILDVGGGASTLVDELLAQGYTDLTVLDVSEAALARSKTRLGRQAGKVSWIVADVTTWRPPRRWHVWHDRAVFHFLTGAADQDAYVSALKAATVPGSVAVMSCSRWMGRNGAAVLQCNATVQQRWPPGLAGISNLYRRRPSNM